MSCIICFLDDDFQERIRNLSHRKSEKFEKTLEDYRDSFICELSLLDDIENCEVHIGHPIDKNDIENRINFIYQDVSFKYDNI